MKSGSRDWERMTHLEARLVRVSECRKGAIAAREKVICRESLGKVGLGGGACVFFLSVALMVPALWRMA